MSFVERFIIQCPYFGGSTIGGLQIIDDSAKFQTITSLTTETDAWGAECGVYHYLLLLSLATKFQPSMYLELNTTRL